MIINEAYEGYTMLLGFFLNNRIWDLMIITGAFAIPILLMVAKAVVDAYKNGDDEGDRGSMALRYIELGTIKIVLVMVFFMMPLGEPLSVTSITYNDHTCKPDVNDGFLNTILDQSPLVNVLNSGNENKSASSLTINNINLSVNGVEARPPIIIGLVQNYSTKFTNAVISSIPCSTDIVSIGLSVENLNIKHKDTQDVLVDVIKQCYAPLFKEATISQNMTADEVYDKYWIGAPYFTGGATGGNATYALPTSTATVPLENYIERVQRAYNASSPNLSNGQYAKQGNYLALDAVQDDGNVVVQCDHYYDILEGYVKQDYKTEIEDLDSPYVIDSLDSLKMTFNKYFGDDNQAKNGISVIMKRLVEAVNNPGANNFEKTQSNSEVSGLDFLKDTIVGVGTGVAGVKKMVDAWYVRVLANPILAMIQCVVFMMAPVIFLLSNYDMKLIGGYLVTIFGLEFVVLIFEVCDWLSDNLFAMSSSAYSSLDTSHGTTQFAIFTATSYSYFILPLVWLTILGKVGMMISKEAVMGISDAAQASSKEGQSSAKSGAGTAGKAGKAAFKAGKESTS